MPLGSTSGTQSLKIDTDTVRVPPVSPCVLKQCARLAGKATPAGADCCGSLEIATAIVCGLIRSSTIHSWALNRFGFSHRYQQTLCSNRVSTNVGRIVSLRLKSGQSTWCRSSVDRSMLSMSACGTPVASLESRHGSRSLTGCPRP